MPPLLVRKKLLRRSFQARCPPGPGLRPSDLPLLEATSDEARCHSLAARCLECCDPRSSCLLTVTARGPRFGEHSLSLLEKSTLVLSIKKDSGGEDWTELDWTR